MIFTWRSFGLWKMDRSHQRKKTYRRRRRKWANRNSKWVFCVYAWIILSSLAGPEYPVKSADFSGNPVKRFRIILWFIVLRLRCQKSPEQWTHLYIYIYIYILPPTLYLEMKWTTNCSIFSHTIFCFFLSVVNSLSLHVLFLMVRFLKKSSAFLLCWFCACYHFCVQL